jgi:riboflavin synthase
MFTGIITDVGTITAIDPAANFRVQIQTKYDTAKIPLGASISCNGVCLTNIETGQTENMHWFAAQVSEETRAKTTAGRWQVGTKLNLERALVLGDELGGHLVLGHVDGVANVKSIEKIQDSTVITIALPAELLPLIAPKGSVCLDGVSLTVNEVALDTFKITIVPHTLSCTTFQHLRPGSSLNIEVDMIARYLARIMSARIPAN